MKLNYGKMNEMNILFIYYCFLANANRKTFKPNIQPGWYYFGRKMVSSDHFLALTIPAMLYKPWLKSPLYLQDTADSEWMMWFSTFREHIVFALSGHVLFGKICSMLAPQVRLKQPCSGYSLCFTLYNAVFFIIIAHT